LSLHWPEVLAEIEDLLFPQLRFDAYERTVYYHLLRHTRLREQESGLFAIAPLANALGLSDFKVRAVLRALHGKGCVVIDERSRHGHRVSVVLPHEFRGLSRAEAAAVVEDPETLDFFTGRKYIAAVLERENTACFYCLRSLTVDTCELDHLVPQVDRIDNSYRNVVAACHGCNKAKSAEDASAFLRARYRSGLLSESEFADRLAALEAVQSGTLVPQLR
jgi:HNH endonuclease